MTLRKYSILALFLVPEVMCGDGATVKLLLHSGEEVTGELLSVREHTLLLASVPGTSEAELEKYPETVVVTATEDIARVTIEGHSRVLAGMGIGFLGGLVIGAIAAPDPDVSDPTGLAETTSRGASALLGGVIGLGVGLLVGAASSTGTEEFAASGKWSPTVLQRHCRYKEGEPEFMRGISRN
jgi:hypothetical protein